MLTVSLIGSIDTAATVATFSILSPSFLHSSVKSVTFGNNQDAMTDFWLKSFSSTTFKKRSEYHNI